MSVEEILAFLHGHPEIAVQVLPLLRIAGPWRTTARMDITQKSLAAELEYSKSTKSWKYWTSASGRWSKGSYDGLTEAQAAADTDLRNDGWVFLTEEPELPPDGK